MNLQSVQNIGFNSRKITRALWQITNPVILTLSAITLTISFGQSQITATGLVIIALLMLLGLLMNPRANKVYGGE